MSTTNDVILEIDQAKAAEADLNDLNSASAVSIWRLWRYLVAKVEATWRKKRADHTTSVQAIIDKSKFGTEPWFVEKALAFRYGYALTRNQVNGGVLQYEADALADDSALIIKRTSLSKFHKMGIWKVAKEDGNGDPIALTNAEMTAFSDYAQEVGPPHENIMYRTSNPDLFKIEGTYVYDRELPAATVRSNIFAKAKEYAASGLDSDGSFRNLNLTARIREATGFLDADFNYYVKKDGGDWVLSTRRYITYAGFIALDEVSSNIIAIND